MGMAASQARLLFITTRQSDVTAQLERISNDHIILAKNESKIAEQYDRMLNAKKLMPADHIELSYDVLMKGGNFIQDPKNAFVLSKDLATQLGLTDEDYAKGSGTFDLGDKSAFISKFARVDQSKVDKVQDSLLGLDAWIEKSNQEDPPKYPILKETPTRPKFVETPKEYSFSEFINFLSNTKQIINIDNKEIDLSKAIKNEQYYSGCLTVDEDKSNALSNLKTQVTNSAKNYVDFLTKSVQKYIFDGSNDDSPAIAGESVKNAFEYSETVNEKDIIDEVKAQATGLTLAYVRNARWGDDYGGYGYDKKAINEAFFKNLQTQLGLTPSINTKLKFTTNNQKDIDAWDKEKAQAETDYNTYKNSLEIDPETEMPQIEYASKLYDTFNTKQWTADTEGISEEPDGRAILADGIDKGKYTAMGKTKADLVQWVDDEEMQKRAEIFKETEEKKIKNKEKKLDTEEAKLQTELTALNNDYTSVKGIIEANIQKSFSYCSNA